MKSILCYGDSNTWGNIAGTFNEDYILHQRYEYGVRWPTIVQTLLGSDYHVIEAGLNARSTAFDEKDIIRASRNGLKTLPDTLEMHYPLDLVILMLGTNDLKIQYNASVEQITQNIQQLIHTIKSSHFGPNFQAPKVMLISPALVDPIAPALWSDYYSQESVDKSHQLAESYAQLAKTENCIFLDAKSLITLDLNDGLHFDRESHKVFAEAVVEKIREFL